MQVVHSVLHAVIFLSGMGMVGGGVSQYHFKEKKVYLWICFTDTTETIAPNHNNRNSGSFVSNLVSYFFFI